MGYAGYLHMYLYPIVNCFMVGYDECGGILSIVGCYIALKFLVM